MEKNHGKEESEKEKIKRAIWIHNRLIDRHRELYLALKEQYEKEVKDGRRV
jgi:hypothetical protein